MSKGEKQNGFERNLPEEKKELGYSVAKIAELASLPKDTVNYYFTKNSKGASIHTVGPICKALGVSIDRAYGIGDVKLTTEDLTQLRSAAEMVLQIIENIGVMNNAR